MPEYTIWLLADNYDRYRLLRNWTKLIYHQTLNAVGALEELSVPINDELTPALTIMRRLLIYRDGQIVWGGMVQREGWQDPENAPISSSYKVAGHDHAIYAQWRIVTAPAGQDYHAVTDHADDAAKTFVRYHMGPLVTVAARQFPDLTIEADKHQCASVTKHWRGEQIMERIQALAAEKGFYWRFVPTATGCTFTTKYPLWGADRAVGNGINRECVFSIDRRNVTSMEYSGDAMEHYNYMYVAGQGEGKDRVIIERSTAADITAYKRRELWVDARNYSNTADLQAEGDQRIEEKAPSFLLTCQPLVNTWKTFWDLGDRVSLRARKYNRDFALDPIIKSVKVEVGQDGVEYVTPTMEE